MMEWRDDSAVTVRINDISVVLSVQLASVRLGRKPFEVHHYRCTNQNALDAVSQIGLAHRETLENGPSWQAVLQLLEDLPAPSSHGGKAVDKLRGERLAKTIPPKTLLSNVMQLPRTVTEYSMRLRKRFLKHGVDDFPNAEFIERVSLCLREDTMKGTHPSGYGKWREEILNLVNASPARAKKELVNAQKSENAERRAMVRWLATDAQDSQFLQYATGMTLVRSTLIEKGYLEDLPSRGLFRFLHEPHEYLNGLVPERHPIGALFLASEDFCRNAVIRFLAKPIPPMTLARFYGAVEAVAQHYKWAVDGLRTADLDKKRDRRFSRGYREEASYVTTDEEEE